jgi:hypothetical protein
MRSPCIFFFLAVALVATLSTTQGWAGTIALGTYNVAAGGGASADSRIQILATNAVNNHTKHGNNPSTNTGPGFFNFKDATKAADVALPITASKGITDYFISESVTNNTKAAWTNFEIELGFGTGAGFKLTPAGNTAPPFFDGVAANPGPTPTSDTFKKLLSAANELEWKTGNVPIGDTVLFTFEIAVPDTTLKGKPVPNFTLHQFPTTNAAPEPSTLMLFGVGMGALFIYSRRRRRP